MKRLILAGFGLILLAACGGQSAAEAERMQAERDSLTQIIAERDNELNDFMGLFNEVQEGLKSISEAEGRVTVIDANLESASTQESIRENMAFIKEAMEQNRTKINLLQEKLRGSSLKGDKLKKMVDELSARLEAQTLQIQELEVKLAEKNVQIDSLISNVNTLAANNEKQAQKMLEQDEQLHTAWFVFGTKAELKEQRILKNGEVLKDGDFNKSYFTQIDTRYDKEINLYSKNAKLLTSHPSGSYSLGKDGKGQYVLKVINPDKFWSVSRYLVVQVR